MNNRHKFYGILGIALCVIGIIPLFFIESEIYAANWAILLLIVLFFVYLNTAIKSSEKILSPISMLIVFNSLYTIMGVTMWLYREINFTNWGGEFWDVLYIYVVVDFLLSIVGICVLEHEPSRLLNVNVAQMRLKQMASLICFLFEYIGIYLFTAGFKIIPLLTSDIDESRFELGETDRPGAGLGSLLINFGILIVIHIFYSKKPIYIKLLAFVIAYIPFVLYGGRFQMVMPLVLIAILIFIRRIKTINFWKIIKVTLFVVIVFLAMMFYGTFRKAGNDVETDLVLDFMTADLFPEFRGSIASYFLNKKDLSLDYIGFMLTSFFPGSLLDIIGIDKSSQISIGGYVAQLLGLSGHYGIRTSFTGELLLTNPITFIIIWLLYLWTVLRINRFYFKYIVWNHNKLLMLFYGLSLGTIIPYGISLLPNTLIMIIVFSMFSSLAYKKMNTKILQNKHG